MALPETGPISVGDLKFEFGSDNTSSILSDFYSNLNYRVPRRYGIPNYGSSLSLSNFRGAQGFSASLEQRLFWSGSYGENSETNLGGVADYSSPDYTVKWLRINASVGVSQGKKHRWIVVVATHFHWLDGGGGIYGAGMFRNIRLANGEQGILIKDRVVNYAGESYSVYMKAFPIPDSAVVVELVLEQPYGAYNEQGVLEWVYMWGEFQLSVIGLTGMGDSPSFRTFDVDGFGGPFNLSLNSNGDGNDTIPRKSVAIIAACGRGGDAGVCSEADQSNIFGGQGLYLDHNLSSSNMVYTAQHNTVSVTSGVVIDY